MTSILTTPLLCCLVFGILSLTMSAPVSTKKSRSITLEAEAEQIVLDATDALLADPKLMKKVIQDVKIIRAENPRVVKTLNNGRKLLGKLEIENYSADLLKKINKSKFAPATATISNGPKGTSALISFPKHYNPDVLSRELSELGVSADPIWMTGPDYGHIEYKQDEDTYTFREGFDNCKPNCKDNHFWVFKITNGKSKLVMEYATDIPEIRIAPSAPAPEDSKA